MELCPCLSCCVFTNTVVVITYATESSCFHLTCIHECSMLSHTDLTRHLMTITPGSRNPFVAPDQPTMADAIARLQADEGMRQTRRRDMISALNCVVRIM